MGTEFVSRKDISVLTGLGKAAVARLVELPEFPSGTWINSRVVIYPINRCLREAIWSST